MKPAWQNIDWSLYAILDRQCLHTRSITSLAEEMIAGGVGVIQLRDKHASARQLYEAALPIRHVTRHRGVPFIINDRVDIAMAVEADGVHLGQDDLPLADARACLGEEAIIGASVHDDEEFVSAVKGEADYLGVGTIFATETKPDLPCKGPELLKSLRPKTNLPLVAIGGIKVDNVAEAIAAGADGVAVISSLIEAPNVKARAEAFLREINSAKNHTARQAATLEYI
ncbi:thiamine phosphate synthase [bacterium]|nr:thiamine phosphate synthase [bacterium]